MLHIDQGVERGLSIGGRDVVDDKRHTANADAEQQTEAPPAKEVAPTEQQKRQTAGCQDGEYERIGPEREPHHDAKSNVEQETLLELIRLLQRKDRETSHEQQDECA